MSEQMRIPLEHGLLFMFPMDVTEGIERMRPLVDMPLMDGERVVGTFFMVDARPLSMRIGGESIHTGAMFRFVVNEVYDKESRVLEQLFECGALFESSYAS